MRKLHFILVPSAFAFSKTDIHPLLAPWDEFRTKALSRHLRRNEKDGPAIIGVKFPEDIKNWKRTHEDGTGGYRNHKNIEAFSCLFFDLDGPGELEKIYSWAEKEGVEGSFFTTYSYHPQNHPEKWRGIFPLASDVTPDRWPTFWNSVSQWHGVPLQDTCGGKSMQIFYLPSSPKNIEGKTLHVKGAWLDPEAVIKKYPETIIHITARREKKKIQRRKERINLKKSGYWIPPPHQEWRIEKSFKALEYFSDAGLLLSQESDRIGIQSPAAEVHSRGKGGPTSSVIFLPEKSPPYYYSSRATDKGWTLPELLTFCHKTKWAHLDPWLYGAYKAGELPRTKKPYLKSERIPLSALPEIQAQAESEITDSILKRFQEKLSFKNDAISFLKSTEITHALCYQWSAGSGKSEMAIQLIKKYSDEFGSYLPIEYFVPTQKLQSELFSRMVAAGIPADNIQIILGIKHFLEEDCIHADLIKFRMEMGYSFSDICKVKKRKCENFNECPYQKQFLSTAKIKILAHNYLFLSWKRYIFPGLVIIDEDFSEVGFFEKTIPIQWIKDASYLAPLEIQLFINLVEQKNIMLHFADNCDSFSFAPALEKIIKRTSKRKNKRKPCPPIEHLKALIFIVRTLDALWQENCKHPRKNFTNALQVLSMEETNHLKLTCRNEMIFHLAKKDRDGPPPTPPLITMINADANKTILAAHFPHTRIKFSVANLQKKATFVQIAQFGKTYSRTAIVEERFSVPPKAFLDTVYNFYRLGLRVLTVTYQPVIQWIQKNHPDLIREGFFDWLYWGGPIRGLDAFKGHDVVIAFGRPRPPDEAILDKTRALFFDTEKPFDSAIEYKQELRAINCLRHDGFFPAMPCQVPKDPRIAAVLAHATEADTIQALDRLRLVHTTQEKLCILWTTAPIDCPIDHALREMDILQASNSAVALLFSGEGHYRKETFPVLLKLQQIQNQYLKSSRELKIVPYQIGKISRQKVTF